jgi:outer membrane lipopolysaccharide assembly protein LptE/RlpB
MRAKRAALNPILRAVVAATLLLHGCGYALVGRGKSTLPDHITSIAVPMFANQTLEPELEKDITSAVRQRFIRDGRLKVVDTAKATALIEGRLENYVLDPLAFDRSDRVTQYRVVIGVHVTVRDMVKGKVLLDQDFSAREEFEVTSAIGSREAAKVTSRQVASQELAGQLLNLILEGF